MKFGNKKVLATIVAVAVATTLAGCSKDENNSVQGDSDTEKDLLTSSSSIDIWSAPESIDSTLNSYDTSKPIEKDENPTGDASSDDENPTGDLTDDGTSESDGDSSLIDETSDDDATSGDNGDSSTNSSTGETSSSGETSKPSDNTTSVPSDSSNSSLTDGTSDSDSSNSSANSSSSNDANSNSSSSSSNTAPWSDMPETITIPDGAVGEYFDVNGNPMPDDFDPDEGGFYDKKGRYHTSAEEYEAMIEANRRAEEAIKNGDQDAYGNVTEEGAAELYKIFFGT